MVQPDEATQGDRGPGDALETTARLLARAREGDASARDLLLSRYLKTLRRWAHGRLPTSARGLLDTDDLVQITLLKALDHLDGFEPRREGAYLAYLRRILVNQIRDQIRRARRGPRREPMPESVPDETASPLERAIGAEALESYEAALNRLPAVQHEAVVLRMEMEHTYPEVAEALDLPSANAARMLVARALVKLAEIMDSHEQG